MDSEEQKDLLMSDDFTTVENSSLWREEKMLLGISFTPDQFETFKRGYQPDWECRYEPHYINGCIYISRSGIWVKKYVIEFVKVGEPGDYVECYDVIKAYSTEREYGRPLLAEILAEGYFEPRIWEREEAEEWFNLYEDLKKAKPIIEVMRKPRKCRVCGSKSISSIAYGMMAGQGKKNVIPGGCVMNPDSPHYVCNNCGQNYINKILRKLYS